MLETWEIEVLKNDLLDYDAWAAHTVAEGIYPDKESALKDKARKCKQRMINQHESASGKLAGKTNTEKIEYIVAQPSYKNRIERDALLI